MADASSPPRELALAEARAAVDAQRAFARLQAAQAAAGAANLQLNAARAAVDQWREAYVAENAARIAASLPPLGPDDVAPDGDA